MKWHEGGENRIMLFTVAILENCSHLDKSARRIGSILVSLRRVESEEDS